MSLKDDFDVLDAVWDRSEILKFLCDVMDDKAEQILNALLSGRHADVGKIIAKPLGEIFRDEADALQDATYCTRAQEIDEWNSDYEGAR